MKGLLRALLKWLLRGLAALLIAIVGYVAYAHWAWRDIPVAALEARYGSPALGTAVVAGLPIRYELLGDAGKPVLVLIHSHYLDMGMWDGWRAALAPHYRLLRFDLAGHGLTGPDASGRYSVARDVQLLDGLLQQLGIADVALVGSSLGGNIAFTFAARQPQRVKALVLVNSGGLKRANSRRSGQIPAWADQLMPLIPPFALNRFLRWMAAGNVPLANALTPRFVDSWRREGNRPAELARLRQFETGEPAPVLAAITAPTLILWGEANPQLPVALAGQFASLLTAAKSVQSKTYAGAGHLLPVERPAETAAAVRTFLQGEGW